MKSTNLKTIIIDDELIGINALKLLIEKHTEGIEVIDFTTDAEKGITLIDEKKPDIVFLDISMPKMNGFELLDKLTYKDFKLVFTTAHEEYAIKAIKNRAQDYLLKPIDITDLKECVKNLLANIEGPIHLPKNSSNLVELAVKDGIIFIKPQDIIRLEASGSYTIFYLENNIRHVASKNLKECEAMLDHSLFYRCHLSHVINLKKVVKMVSADGLYAKMTDDSMAEILRRNKEILLEKLKHLQS